jgi:hypothetical protein
MAALPQAGPAEEPAPCVAPPARRGTIAHRRAATDGTQQAWIMFGGRAELPWLRLLRPGFRHCFAAIAEDDGWLVLDPLSGRLVATRLDLPPGFDLPGFYRRAGFRALGPFVPAGPRRRRLPALRPMTCVGLCQAVLGADAPPALTPYGLYRSLRRRAAESSTNVGNFS